MQRRCGSRDSLRQCRQRFVMASSAVVKVNTVACFANFLMFIVHVSFFMYCVSGLLLPALLFEDGKLVTHNKKRPKICKG